MMAVVTAEWLKLRTTRLLLGMVPAAVGLACVGVAGVVLSADSPTELESAEGIQDALSVASSGALLTVIIGIVIAASEYQHGTAADTFLTTPRRQQVLAAKLTVGAAVGAAVGTAIALASFAVAGVLYGVEGATFPLADADVWLTLGGAMVYATIFAVMGVGLGSLVRNQVAAVAVALAWFAVVEHTLVHLVPDVGRWMPAAAGQAIVRTPIEGLLSPAAGTAVLVAYGAGLTVLGLQAVVSRDI